MRQLFHGHYRPNNDELESLWNAGLVVLDANVLLNVYRYSAPARDTLLAVLRKLTERLWIPYQFAMEYHKRRIDVIASQAKNCDDTHKSLQAILRGFRSPRSHALVGDELLRSIETICEALKASAQQYENLLGDDEYLTIITKLFEGRVGQPPSESSLTALRAEAESRFRSKIPPGYEDEKPKSSSDAFGDYIGWAQMLEHAKASSRDVILVTDDRKGDWWIDRRRGRSIGPRPELLEEFRRLTGQLFYMYAPDRFMEIAAPRLDVPIESVTLEEVRDQSSQVADFEKETVAGGSSIHSPKLYGASPVEEFSAPSKAEKADDPVPELPKQEWSDPKSGEL